MRVSIFLCLVGMAWGRDLHFVRQVIADDLRGGYQVVVADLNHDGKPDLIALASGMDELVWYEAPTWTRHVLVRGLSGMINCAVVGNEVVVAHGFNNDASKSAGIVSVLHPAGDVRELWSAKEIDRLPTSHRLRVARMDGQAIVVNAPLTGEKARPPEFHDQVPLVYYRPGVWVRELIDDRNFGVQHGIFISGSAIYTASFAGIHRYIHTMKGWNRTEIAKGDPAACPACGTSDVAITKNGTLWSIEPWHGHQIVRYVKGKRTIVDDSLSDTHSIIAADLDGDGRDEIVVAQRGAPGRVIVYRGKTKQVVDEGIRAAACAAADLNADRRVDVVCIGGAELRVYWGKR